MNTIPKNKQAALGEELFGKASDHPPEISPVAVDDAVSEAAAWGEIGFQVDPEIADEICAELVSAADLEKIQP